MLERIGGSIKFKLLMVVLVVFFLSFSGILFSVITIQQKVSAAMEEEIASTLEKTGDTSHGFLNSMQDSVNDQLAEMENQAVEKLLQLSRSDLVRMENHVKRGMEHLLESEAKAIIDLLKSVAPSIIVDENFNDLVTYSKAASKTESILFTLFVDPDGEPYPGYVNPSDPKVREFLNRGKGETGIERLLDASGKAGDVLIKKEPIEFYGKNLGSIILCISRDEIRKELDLLSGAFQTQIKRAKKQIRGVLAAQSSAVTDQIKTDIASVARENSRGVAETAGIIAGYVDSQKERILVQTGVFSTVALVISVFILWLFMGKMLKPLTLCAAFAEEVGSGNLNAAIPYTSSDEIGVTAGAMDKMAEKLRQLMEKLGETSRTISDSSANLTEISNGLSTSSSSMETLSDNTTRETGSASENIRNIASSSEEINAQIKAIADSSSDVSKNVTTVGAEIGRVSEATTSVASAIEEMYGSLNEVASNSGKGASITEKASSQAAATSSIVDKLGKSAEDIEKVVSLISGIASQTNLLALNAAIEAAGAGEAGKGFAVVANEVKELAKQTSNATLEIREEIQGMQTNTRDAVDAIESIVDVINQINVIMGTIASAVEEQTATINEISRSISSTAGSAEELNDNADETIRAVSEIATSIDQVSHGSQLIAKDAAMAASGTEKVLTYATQTNQAVKTSSLAIQEVGNQARELASLSSGLNQLISRFKI